VKTKDLPGFKKLGRSGLLSDKLLADDHPDVIPFTHQQGL
jgi:hypothetical protein